MRGYYSVFNPRGEKIADCGAERDAVNLLGMRNRRWEGHYYTFTPLPGDVVDVNHRKQFEPYIPVRSIAEDIIVNMDGGVGGSWQIESQPILEEGDDEIFLR